MHHTAFGVDVSLHHQIINDAEAKAQVKEILSSFGWKDSEILDLGDITTARGT